MKPNILKFWFWRARLMVAGLHDSKDKIEKIQVSDELTIELHPAAGPDKRPMLKLSRNVDNEPQSVNIYLKEVPLLIDFLPQAIAQLMALGAAQHNLRKIRRVEILKSKQPELVE